MRCCPKPSAHERLDARHPVTPRRRKVLLTAGMLAVALALGARWLLQADNLAPLLLAQAERATGLEISARGASEYRLRGTPQVVLRQVVARVPGETGALLSADRVLLAVPWSTLRARGRELAVTRIELDAPVLSVPALQRWLASRPESAGPTPTLSDGLRITDGTLGGDGWVLRDVQARVPRFDEAKPLQATVSGLYSSSALDAPFDVSLVMKRPASGSALGLVGTARPATASWSSNVGFRLSGVLHYQANPRLDHAVFGAHVQHRAGGEPLRFAVGFAGPVRMERGRFGLQPLALALRGEGAVPELDAEGAVYAGSTLQLQLEGQLARWPEAWPALPPPLSQQRSPLPFSLAYDGATDLSGVASLQLRRDATRLDSRFRLPAMLAWSDAMDAGSPLPPMSGTLATPRLEISGAVLEGVEVSIEDPELTDGSVLQ